MKIQFSSFLYLFCLLLTINSNRFLKSNNRKTVQTCNYSYLNQINQISPSQKNIDILGNAAFYAVLAGSKTTNSGHTTIIGSLGISPLTDIAGSTTTNSGQTTIVGSLGIFPLTDIAGVTFVGGLFHASDQQTLIAKNSTNFTYNYLANLTSLDKVADLTGTDLVGLTLYPGQYRFTSGAFLSAGILTLDAHGYADADWLFTIASTLVTSVGAEVKVIGGGSPFNVYWQIGESATISKDTKMVGNIIANSEISFGLNASLTGRALSRIGSVNMQSNFIASVPCKLA